MPESKWLWKFGGALVAKVFKLNGSGRKIVQYLNIGCLDGSYMGFLS